MKGLLMKQPNVRMQKERTPVEKILAGLVIAGEHWVGFFPEDKIQEALSELIKLIGGMKKKEKITARDFRFLNCVSQELIHKQQEEHKIFNQAIDSVINLLRKET